MTQLVIVRAYRGKPARAVEIERNEKLVYVASEHSLDRIASGETEPVGVPKEDVFPFDAEAYVKLQEKWQAGNIDEQWRKMTELVSKG